MTDQEIANALSNLGLGRHNYRAVALLPLFEVAWADGRIQDAERTLLRERAAVYGITPDDGWLQRWMTQAPSPATALAARQVLLALHARSGHGWEAPETLDDLLLMCTRVAEAAGGLFGLAFTVERSEREAIREIAGTLALGPQLPPGVVRAWNTARRPPPTPDPLSQVATQLRPRRRRTVEEVEAEQEGRSLQEEAARAERAIQDSLNEGRPQRFVTPPPPPDPGALFDEDDDTQTFGDHLTGGRPHPGATVIPDDPTDRDIPEDEDTTSPYFEGRDPVGGTFILDEDEDETST